MIKDDGRVLHFTSPKVQASLTANTFAITGNCEEKRMITLTQYYKPLILFVYFSIVRDVARPIQPVGH